MIRPFPKHPDRVTVRASMAADAARLRELAALDSRRPLAGELLVAEVDGALVAAISLEGDGAIGDPFRPTADVVNLLELRAAQIARPAAGARQRSIRRAGAPVAA
jgi:hypothetical protein